MRAALLALAVSLTAHAGPLEQVQARLAPFHALKADFTQQKQVAGLRRPLTSRGHLVYAKGKGLLWAVDQPIASETLLTDTKLVQRVKGQVTLTLDAKQQPGFQAVARIFLSLVTGQWQQLERDFAVEGGVDGPRWHLALTPKGGVFSKVAQRLEVTGARGVEQVVMHEPGGDTTTLTFSSPQLDPKLSAEEEAGLAPP